MDKPDDDMQPLMEPAAADNISKKTGGVNLPEKSEGQSSKEERLAKMAEQYFCCCIPLKAGITIICWFDILTVLFLLAFTIVLFKDVHLQWWYPLVNLCLIAGLGFTALAFCFTYLCSRDTKSTRNNVAIAQLLILALWISLSIWNIIYVNEFYEDNQVNLGYETPINDENGEQTGSNEHYWTMEKSTFVLFNFCQMCLMGSVFYYVYYMADNFQKMKRADKEPVASKNE